MVFDRQPQCEVEGYRLVTGRLPTGAVFLIRDDVANKKSEKTSLPAKRQTTLQRLITAACDQNPQCAMVTTDGALLGIYADFSVMGAEELLEWSVPVSYCPGTCCGTYISDGALDALKPQARSLPVEKQSWTKPTEGRGPASGVLHIFRPNDKNRTRMQQCKVLQNTPRAYPSCPEVCRVACCIPKMWGDQTLDFDIKDMKERIFMLDYEQCSFKCRTDDTRAACGFSAEQSGSEIGYPKLRFFYKNPTRGPRAYGGGKKVGGSKPAARGATAKPLVKCAGTIC